MEARPTPASPPRWLAPHDEEVFGARYVAGIPHALVTWLTAGRSPSRGASLAVLC